MINNILDLAKAEAGRLELREATLDVAGVLEACMCMIEVAGPKGVSASFLRSLPIFRLSWPTKAM